MEVAFLLRQSMAVHENNMARLFQQKLPQLSYKLYFVRVHLVCEGLRAIIFGHQKRLESLDFWNF